MSLWLTYDRAKSYPQISQSSYIKKALKMFGLEHLKASSTPMATGVEFTRDDVPEIVDTKNEGVFPTHDWCCSVDYAHVMPRGNICSFFPRLFLAKPFGKDAQGSSTGFSIFFPMGS